MKIFILPLFLLEFGTFGLAQGSKDIELNIDSIKTEIKRFENRVFELPIDKSIDSTAIYVSMYRIKSSSKIKANGQPKRKKSFSYFIKENDSISVRKLEMRNKGRIIKDNYIKARDKTFIKLKNHSLLVDNRQIVGLREKYLVVRDSWHYSTTDSRHTGPSYFMESYIFYVRIN